MEPQDMTKAKRRIIFYILVLVFAASLPLIIAFSLGYTFNLKLGRIQETGGVFVKSEIGRAAVFLDNEFVKETSALSNGALLTEITPGKRILRLEKAGYWPWSKVVQVNSSEVEDFRNIILVPNPLVYNAASGDEIKTIISSAGNNFYILPSQTLEFPPPPPVGSDKIYITLTKKGALEKKIGTTTTVISSQVNSAGQIDNTVLFADENGFLAKFDVYANAVANISRPGFYLSAKPMKFIPSPAGDETAILDSAGGIFLLDQNNNLKIMGGGTKEASFDSEGQKLLISKENSVEILWLRDNPRQPFQKAGTKEEIINLKEPILGAKWFYGDDAHILIRGENGIFLTEADGRGGRNTVQLVSGKTDDLMTDPNEPQTVFFRKNKIWQKFGF